MHADVDTARFQSVREREFPWSAGPIYLNAASFGPLPARTVAAMEAFNRRRHAPHDLPDSVFGEVLDRARSAAARLIGANADEMALGPNTTVGLNMAAGLLTRSPAEGGARDDRRTVVVSDREFPANVYPWLQLREAGIEVDVVRTDEMGLPREDALLERLQGPDVAAFALSFVQFSTGWTADLARFGAVCRDRDILFVVDAIQGVGAVPLDVNAAHIDILSCGAQKWLCSPWGTGFTYVRRDLCTRIRPSQPGWLAYSAAMDFTRLLSYDSELLPDARRFEIGSLAIQDFVGMSESVELLLELGIDAVHEQIRRVQQPLLDWLERREDVQVASDLSPERRSGIVCIRPRNAEAVHAALDAAGVRCVVREGGIRLAAHFYNTPDEMRRVVEILERTSR